MCILGGSHALAGKPSSGGAAAAEQVHLGRAGECALLWLGHAGCMPAGPSMAKPWHGCRHAAAYLQLAEYKVVVVIRVAGYVQAHRLFHLGDRHATKACACTDARPSIRDMVETDPKYVCCCKSDRCPPAGKMSTSQTLSCCWAGLVVSKAETLTTPARRLTSVLTCMRLGKQASGVSNTPSMSDLCLAAALKACTMGSSLQ